MEKSKIETSLEKRDLNRKHKIEKIKPIRKPKRAVILRNPISKRRRKNPISNQKPKIKNCRKNLEGVLQQRETPFMNENEKEKENKSPSETDSYEVYEGEGEQAGEAEELEISLSERSSSPAVCPTLENISVSVTGEEEQVMVSSEEKKRLILRERWLTMTGRKPRNIPIVRKYTEDIQNVVFFGDQRPAEVEEKIRKKMMLKSQEIKALGIRYGKVLQEIRLSILSSNLVSARFLSSPDYFITCDRGGEVQVRDVNSGQKLLSCDSIERKYRLAARSVSCYPNEPQKLYAAGDVGAIEVFDLSSGELLDTSATYHGINNVDFSARGNFLGAAGKKGAVYFFDPSTLQIISDRGWPCGAEATMPGLEDSYHRMRVYALKAHPEQDNLFATAGIDSTLKIWDVRTVPAIRSVKCPAVHGDGLDIVDNNIITASWKVENSLNQWDFFSGRLIKKIPIKCKSTIFDGEFLFCCKIFKNFTSEHSFNKKLIAVGGSGFSDVLIIHIDTEKVVSSLPSFKPVSCIDVYDNLVVYGGMESVIRLGRIKAKA